MNVLSYIHYKLNYLQKPLLREIFVNTLMSRHLSFLMITSTVLQTTKNIEDLNTLDSEHLQNFKTIIKGLKH